MIGALAVLWTSDHPRPVGTDEAQRLQLVECLGRCRPLRSLPPSGRRSRRAIPIGACRKSIGRPVRPSRRPESLLPFGPPARLLEGRDVEITPRHVFLAYPLAAVDDRSRHEFELDAIGMKQGQVPATLPSTGMSVSGGMTMTASNPAATAYRQVNRRHSPGRYREPGQTERPGHRNGHCHAPIFE